MITTFIVETDQPDCDGSVIHLDGIKFHNPIQCWDNFKTNIAPVALNCNFQIADGKLYCTTDVPDDYLDRFPAIGFTVIKQTKTLSGIVYESIVLYNIGLCDKPNLNPNIKTIRQQIQDNETP